MDLAIRADGGPSIGYGHLVRTSTLAEYVIDHGGNVVYITRTPDAANQISSREVEVVSIDLEDGQERPSTWPVDFEPDIVLTDSYNIGTEEMKAIRRHFSRLAVILDDTRFTVHADILINGNAYARSLEYDWVGPEPEWCLGTDYLLLREEIRNHAVRSPPFRDRPERVLITMGGSDIRGTTPDAIRAFDGLDLSVDVIVGPGFENQKEIREKASQIDARFDIVRDPNDLPDRMFDADLAVSATGSTVYELLALRTPTIGIPQADNQEPIATTLDVRGALIALRTVKPDQLRKTILSLAEDPKRRRLLRDQGASLVDGRGVDRVYDMMQRIR